MSETANGASSITTIATAPAHLIPQQRSVSPVMSSANKLSLSRPPLPFRRAPIISSSGGAFTSYVRRRGEPDGGRTDAESGAAIVSARVAAAVAAASASHMAGAAAMDSSQTNTTDSELSDGYTSQTLNKFEPKPKMGFSSLRAPVKVGRPGGGGESDAAFTPSPPVTMDSNVSLALAHQTRIRNLYSAGFAPGNDAAALAMAAAVGQHHQQQQQQHQQHHQQHNANHMIARRPDSSSSASSTTDWEGSGHATVLRRANQQTHQQVLPPLPPPRQTMPLVDSLRPLAPLAPVYNNLGLKQQIAGHSKLVSAAGGGGPALESTSSDSDFERGGFETTAAAAATSSGMSNPNNLLRHGGGGRLKIKPLQQFLGRNITDHTMDFMERFGNGGASAAHHHRSADQPHQQQQPQQQQQQQQPAGPTGMPTKSARNKASSNGSTSNAAQMPDNDGHHHALGFSANNLYFSPADSDPMMDTKKEMLLAIKGSKDIKISATHNKTVQDSIMRHMNREMTPTISEVYHERSLGLGLAPPLSKLLLSKNYDDAETGLGAVSANSSTMLKETVNDLDINNAASMAVAMAGAVPVASSSAATSTPHKDMCKMCNSPADMMCGCKTGTTKKKASSKPWLSNVLPNMHKTNNDQSSADLLVDRQSGKKTNNSSSESQNAAAAAAIVTKESAVCVATLTRNVEAAASSNAAGHEGIKRSNSPFSDLSRRDDGDGRSVADSQCSGNYSKVDISGAVAQKQQQLLRAKFAAMKMTSDDKS